MVAEYDDIVPGAADRFIQLMEKEQTIRSNESHSLIMNDRLKIIGSISISLGMIVAAVYCGLNGQPVLAGVIATSGAIAGIARQFFATRMARESAAK
jgi:uncharacterized membrane protein